MFAALFARYWFVHMKLTTLLLTFCGLFLGAMASIQEGIHLEGERRSLDCVAFVVC